jgi:hypothetical protein
MATAIEQATDLQDGSQPDRELARLAMADEWGYRQVSDAYGGRLRDLGRTIAEYEQSLAPLKEREPKLDGATSKNLADALRPMGAKIAPTMSTEQATAWLAAMVMALSDLPEIGVVKAAREAIHVPIRFPNEVDGVIRAKSEEVMYRHHRAIRRLRGLREMIDMPGKMARSLPPPLSADQDPITAEEIRAMTPSMIRIGLANGWLTQAEVDAALPEPASEEKMQQLQEDIQDEVNCMRGTARQSSLTSGDELEPAAMTAAGHNGDDNHGN